MKSPFPVREWNEDHPLWFEFDGSSVDYYLHKLAIFAEHNPYNAEAQIEGLFNIIQAVANDDYLDEEQEWALYATIFWHIPPTLAHIGYRVGLVPAVSGGFGYYKTLSTMPKLARTVLWANIAYMLAPKVVYALEHQNPYSIIETTNPGGDYMVTHPGGGMSFRNPVTGM